MKRFEDSVVWQKSKKLNIEMYQTFNELKDFGFKDQVLRASVSIMNNIAEGFERASQKELRKFLYISKGSAGEVRSMLVLAKDLNYISGEEFNILAIQSEEISKMLAGFIKKL